MTRKNHLMMLALGGFLVTASLAFAAELTSGDLLYVKQNKLDIDDLSSSQLAGLHNVINDPKTKNDPKARLDSVHTYLGKTAAGNFYCTMNPTNPNCKKP